MRKIYFNTLSILLVLLAVRANAQYELAYALKVQDEYAAIIEERGKLAEFAEDPLGYDMQGDQGYERIISRIQNFKNLEEGAIEEESVYPGGAVSAIGSSILNPVLSEQELIFALTDVIISRAKEELAVAYFDRMVAEMDKKRPVKVACGADTFQMKALFPSFYLLLKNNRSNWNVQIGATLQSALKKDLEQLHLNMDKHFIPGCVKKEASYALTKTMYQVLDGLSKRMHPATILADMRDGVSTLDDNNDVKHIVQLISGISSSILSLENSTGFWVSADDVRRLNATGLSCYLALLYHNPKNNPSFTRYTDKLSKQELAFVIPMVRQLLSIRDKIQGDDGAKFQGNGQQGKAAATMENYEFNVLDDFITLLNTGIELLPDSRQKDKEELYKGVEALLFFIDFSEAIKKTDYSGAVIASLRFADQFVSTEQLPSELVNYLVLAADLSQAEDTDDAKAVLEAAILPVGSYRIKRSTRFSSSVSSYLGMAGGYEMLDYEKMENPDALYTSLFVPVGIDMTWTCDGGATENDPQGSHSLFFSVLDLGTVAGYRFGGGGDSLSANNETELKLKHVLSPGVMYLYGFKKHPIVIGGGMQYSPSLRKITDEGGLQVGMANGLRFNLTIAVDIPLLNLSLRGRRTE